MYKYLQVCRACLSATKPLSFVKNHVMWEEVKANYINIGLVLIKINTVSANFNNTGLSLILNN